MRPNRISSLVRQIEQNIELENDTDIHEPSFNAGLYVGFKLGIKSAITSLTVLGTVLASMLNIWR